MDATKEKNIINERFIIIFLYKTTHEYLKESENKLKRFNDIFDAFEIQLQYII